jgi:hypothetical protein
MGKVTNLWGSVREDVGEGFCPGCEREAEAGHYAGCPDHGVLARIDAELTARGWTVARGIDRLSAHCGPAWVTVERVDGGLAVNAPGAWGRFVSDPGAVVAVAERGAVRTALTRSGWTVEDGTGCLFADRDGGPLVAVYVDAGGFVVTCCGMSRQAVDVRGAVDAAWLLTALADRFDALCEPRA